MGKLKKKTVKRGKKSTTKKLYFGKPDILKIYFVLVLIKFEIKIGKDVIKCIIK